LLLRTITIKDNQSRQAIIDIIGITLGFGTMLTMILQKEPKYHIEDGVVYDFLRTFKIYTFPYPNTSLDLINLAGLILCLVGLFVIRNKNTIFISCLTLWSFISLTMSLWPEILLRFTHPANYYRMILSAVPWLSLPLVFQDIVNTLNTLSVKKKIYGYQINLFKISTYILIFLLIILSFYPYYPIYGKGFHAFYKAPDIANGADLQNAIEFLVKYNKTNIIRSLTPINIPEFDRSYVISDPYTNSYVNATAEFQVNSRRFGWPAFRSKKFPIPVDHLFSQNLTAEQFFEAIQKIQGNYVIYLIENINDKDYLSPTGTITQHWQPDIINTKKYFDFSKLDEIITTYPQSFNLLYDQDQIRIYQIRQLPNQ
jgi:hypothetical protein